VYGDEGRCDLDDLRLELKTWFSVKPRRREGGKGREGDDELRAWTFSSLLLTRLRPHEQEGFLLLTVFPILSSGVREA